MIKPNILNMIWSIQLKTKNSNLVTDWTTKHIPLNTEYFSKFLLSYLVTPLIAGNLSFLKYLSCSGGGEIQTF